MRIRLMSLFLLWVIPICHVHGQKVKPFVKGGLTIALFDGPHASHEDVGHFGPHLGAGIKIPLKKSQKTFLVPAVALVPKGDVYDVSIAGGRVSFNLWYLETQLDYCYRWQIGKNWHLSIGAGLYGAYGIGGKASATNGITWYRGIPVGDSPSMFESEVGANRWDAGGRLWTVGVDYRRFMFRWDYEASFFSQFHNKMPYEREKNNHGYNWVHSICIGYCF